MIQQFRVVALIVTVVSAANSILGARQVSVQQSQDHVAWVSEILDRMQSIKPGMTRDALLTVFKTEGGFHSALHRTFVDRDCPLFKVEVEFQAVGRPSRDRGGRATSIEGGQDIILNISKPFLQGPIMD